MFERMLFFVSKKLRVDFSYLLNSGRWLALGAVIALVGNFLSSVAFANLLPADIYGQYKFIFSVAGVLGALSLTGSAAVITRSVANGFDGTFIKQVGLQLKTSIISVMVGAGVGIYYLFQDNTVLGYGIIIVSIGSPLLRTTTLYNSFLTGKEKFSTIPLFQIFHVTIPIVSLVTTLFLTDNIIYILGVYFLSNIVVHSFFTFITNRYYTENNKIDGDSLKYSIHLSLQGIISPIANHTDKILIFQLLGPAELALYTVATSLPLQFGMAQKGLNMIMLPKLSKQKLNLIQSGARAKTLLLFLTGLVMFVAYYLIAPYLFKIFFPAYVHGVLISQLFALSFLLLPTTLYNLTLYGHQMTKELYVAKILVPVTKIFNIILIGSLYGLYGVVGAILLTQFLELLLLSYLVHRKQS